MEAAAFEPQGIDGPEPPRGRARLVHDAKYRLLVRDRDVAAR
jgi:hypothetical protein